MAKQFYQKIDENAGLKAVQAKDMRIAWLSIFSSLTQNGGDEKEAENLAYKMVKRLYENYPFPNKKKEEIKDETTIRYEQIEPDLEEQKKIEEQIRQESEAEEINKEFQEAEKLEEEE